MRQVKMMRKQFRAFWPYASALFLCVLSLAIAADSSSKQDKAFASLWETFNTNKFADIDAAMTNAIAEKRLPGAVVWIERTNAAWHKAYGERCVVPVHEPMTEDTIFDLASLTKVVATAPSIMMLVERGKINLDAPVKQYVPEFQRNGKDSITIRHLLTHTSGMRSGLGRRVSSAEAAIFYACQEKTNTVPGTAFCYSDINFIMLGEVVKRVSLMPVDEFATKYIFAPLLMKDTCYLPDPKESVRIAPTEPSLRGKVHDPTARGMEGVAGHAGVFSTAADLARYCRMLLNEGELDGVRIMKPETVRMMVSVATPVEAMFRRSLGWDIDTGYSRRGKVFPIGSYGHTGFTGTGLWIDPFSKTFVVFLSNRVHPDGHGDVRTLQNILSTLAAESVIGFNFTNVPGALPPLPTNGLAAANMATNVTTNGSSTNKTEGVLNGIDVLKKENYSSLKNLRIGLITNHTGRDREGNPTIDLLRNAPGVSLKALFSPEHGIRGQLDEKVQDGVDGRTGVVIYSLYGPRRSPTPEQLQNLDALVYDIQDIGCRYYTYISTLNLCMEAAATAKLKFFVLDRVNPINGVDVAGPVKQGAFSFTACHPIPLRHGMTVGELARMYNKEREWNVDLVVIPVQGWKRSMWFEETGLPWRDPSPNMRTMSAATVYPGLGLLEFSISVGRGTDTPFEILGAPYIDGKRLEAELNNTNYPGIQFAATRFTPKSSVFKDKECGGVTLKVTDRNKLEPVRLGLFIASTLQRLYPEQFNLDKVNVLLQDLVLLDAIRSGRTVDEMQQVWSQDLREFLARRGKFLLYN